MYPHQRAEIRLRVRAKALLSFDRNEGKARVRNLSAGGVEVYRPEPRPKVGTRAHVVLQGDDVELGPLEAEVVRDTSYGVAFRFLDIDSDQRLEILAAMQRL